MKLFPAALSLCFMICLQLGNDVEASTRLPLLINPQTLDSSQYITVTGCSSNCETSCCYCNIKKQPPVCLKCCHEIP
ncbi:hypothetical protein DCAR_0624456 [Daucus carota subsp. sativus]|uniref:Uncharacterized protein n=1 Tax=Daucus carota subsp. sativus TaxID=79200 RepID=A0AAF1B398_DAUCS|nr:hypothetical protein DCAR_0624456 [Daucus carota subsp. sativus]